MTFVDIALCVIIIIQIVSHCIERRDLYNRIQAKDYREYKQQSPPKQPKTRHDEVLRHWRYGKYPDEKDGDGA